ncbi:MAG: hypothetical protein RCG15_04155 [Candidatus Rickettsia vulgarisii]
MQSEKIVNKEARKNTLNDLLCDKNILKQDDFQRSGDKQLGATAGYIAKENDTSNIFILKQFIKTPPLL